MEVILYSKECNWYTRCCLMCLCEVVTTITSYVKPLHYYTHTCSYTYTYMYICTSMCMYMHLVGERAEGNKGLG